MTRPEVEEEKGAISASRYPRKVRISEFPSAYIVINTSL